MALLGVLALLGYATNSLAPFDPAQSTGSSSRTRTRSCRRLKGPEAGYLEKIGCFWS